MLESTQKKILTLRKKQIKELFHEKRAERRSKMAPADPSKEELPSYIKSIQMENLLTDYQVQFTFLALFSAEKETMYGIRLLSEFLTKNQNNNNILGELIEFLLNKNVLKEILDFLSKTIKQSNLNEVYSLLSQMSYYLLFIIKEETLNAIINLFILHIKSFITHFIQDVSKTSLITFLLHLSFQNPRFKAVLFSSDDFMSRALQEVKEIKLNINTYNYFLQLLKLLSILAKKEKEITLEKIIALYDAFDSVTKKSPGNESIISVCLYTFSHLLFYKVQMINDKIFELIIKAIRDQPLLESKNEDLIIP